MRSDRPNPKGVVGLSEVDHGLIRALRADGRESFRSLAESLGITQRQVRKRVKELSDAGVLTVTVVANPAVLGYRAVGIVALRARGRRLTEIADDVAAIDTVDYVNVTAGRFQLFAQVVAENLEDLNNTAEDVILKVPGVDSLELFPYRHLHYQATLSGPPSAVVALPRTDQPIDLDGLDRAIIAELSEDGRLPLSQVATTVGTSETQVRRRLKRLTDHGAIRIVAAVNPLSHGYETIARLAVVVAGGHRADEVAEALAHIPTITYVAVCTGRYDIFCEAVCVSMFELDALLDEQVQAVEGILRCETFVHVAQLHYRPLRPENGVNADADALETS